MADDPYKRSRPSPRLNHLDPVTDRRLTDGLLDLSLQGDDDEALMFVADAPGLITGWETTASCPKLDTLDLHSSRSDAANDESVSPSSRRIANRETKYNSDGETFQRTPWEAYVEPTTYRYLPSNGMYRTGKFTLKLDPPKAVRKRPAERLTPKQRQLQKEIQRDLRQEFEMFLQYEKEMEQKIKSGKLNSREKSEDAEESRGVNTEPDDGTNATGIMNTRSRSPLQLPAICVPLVRNTSGQWYLENFDSRLAVLDQEMQRDRFMYRRAKDFVKAVTSRSQSEPPHMASRRVPDLGGFPAINTRYNSGVDDLAGSLTFTKDSQESRHKNSGVSKLPPDNNEKSAETNVKKLHGSPVSTSVRTSVRDGADHGVVDETDAAETVSVRHKHSNRTEHTQLDSSSGKHDKHKRRKNSISSSASSSADGQLLKKSHARNTSAFSTKTERDSTGKTSSLVVKHNILQTSSTSPSCQSSQSGTQPRIKTKKKKVPTATLR